MTTAQHGTLLLQEAQLNPGSWILFLLPWHPVIVLRWPGVAILTLATLTTRVAPWHCPLQTILTASAPLLRTHLHLPWSNILNIKHSVIRRKFVNTNVRETTTLSSIKNILNMITSPCRIFATPPRPSPIRRTSPVFRTGRHYFPLARTLQPSSCRLQPLGCPSYLMGAIFTTRPKPWPNAEPAANLYPRVTLVIGLLAPPKRLYVAWTCIAPTHLSGFTRTHLANICWKRALSRRSHPVSRLISTGLTQRLETQLTVWEMT